MRWWDSIDGEWDQWPLSIHPPKTLDECEPWLLAHRGGESDSPESCVYTYDRRIAEFQAAGLDNLVLEADLQMLRYSDDLLVCHDSTLDRTTDATGSSGGTTGVRTLTDYKDITVDQYAVNGADFQPAEKLKMVTGREFITTYGRRTCLNFECKYTQTRAPLAALIHEYNAEEYSIVYVTTVADRDFFLNEGIRVLVVGSAIGGMTPAELAAIGVRDVGGWVAIGDTATMDSMQQWADEGIKISMHGNRRAEWHWYRQYPQIHSGGYTNSPLWVSGRSPRYTTDNFAGRVYRPGHIPYTDEFPGRFKDLGGGVWGWGPNPAQNGWCLFGDLSPHPKGGHGSWDVMTGVQEIKAPEYPFGWEVDITHFAQASANYWAAMAFANDDMPVNDSRTSGSNTAGRHVLIFFVNMDGNVWLIDVLDNTQTILLAAWNVGAIPVGAKHKFRLEYTDSTHFKITDLTAAMNTTVTIPEGLGVNGYLNIGTPDSGTGTGEWAFSAVTII